MARALDLLQELLTKLFFLLLLLAHLRRARRRIFFPEQSLGAGRRRCILRSLMSSSAARKCLCCNEKFHFDARNRRHQKYCAKEACRKASKSARQARWLTKPENQNYFRGGTNSERVRQWRLANAGYSRRKSTPRLLALQDVSKLQAIDDEHSMTSCTPSPLQDVLLMQPALLVGLISVLTGHALQDDLMACARSFMRRGLDILHLQMAGCDTQAGPCVKHQQAAHTNDSGLIEGKSEHRSSDLKRP
jgi:hypothetical protein